MDELPYKAAFGVWGSYLVMLVSVIALLAQFYVALYPPGSTYLDPTNFFQAYLAGPLLIFLYLVWKVYSWIVRPADRPLFVRTRDIDIHTGMRDLTPDMIGGVPAQDGKGKGGIKGYVMEVFHSLF